MKTHTLLNKYILLFMALILLTSCADIARNPDFRKNRFYYTYKGKPEQLITYREMALMLKQYKNTREGVLKKSLGFEDTRDVWFQIDSLKKYLAYIEKTSRDKHIKITGIKFISAAYPNISRYGKEKDYQTIILNPTTFRGKNPTASFDPSNSKKEKPAYINDLLTPYFNELNGLNINNSEDINKFFSNRNPVEKYTSAFNKGLGNPPY